MLFGGKDEMDDNIIPGTKLDIPYFQTPNKIFDTELNIYQKMIYIYLARCANQGSKAFPSYATITKKCSMGRTKAIATINELIELGIVKKEIRRNADDSENLTNVYVVDNLQLRKND